MVSALLSLADTARQPRMSIVAILIAGSFGVRWLRTGRLSRPTAIDFPLFLFLVSALIGFWVAADRTEAMQRLVLFLGAVGIFYAIVNSETRTLAVLSDGFVIVAAAAGLYLAGQHDWAASPARFDLVGTLGLWLNQFAPRFGNPQLHWNVVRNAMAAVLGLALPLALVRSIAGFDRSHSRAMTRSSLAGPVSFGQASIAWLRVGVFALITVLILFGLLMTESRTPWVVYMIIGGLVFWWWVTGRISSFLSVRRVPLILAVAGIGLAAAVPLLMAAPELTDLLPGPDNGYGRAEIYVQAWSLAEDTPFTGGGLGQFPALYSTYIQVIPHALFLTEDTGNNAYLNVLVEQGWLGLIALIALLGTTIRVAIGHLTEAAHRPSGLFIAGALGLALVVLYGAVHATLVGTRVATFLLVPAGLVLRATSDQGSNSPRSSRLPAAALIAVTVLAVIGFQVRQHMLAGWQSNLGAVEMAQIELANWPTGQWDDGSGVSELSGAELLFQYALHSEPNNRTANHRLGLIRMEQRDYRAAISHLEVAYQQDPHHRGIQKALGYSYVWNGQLELAYPLLVALTEVEGELGVYQWWWGTQGRPDLAGHAIAMEDLLE